MNFSNNLGQDHGERRHGETDRRSGFHLRLPRIRFIRPLVYAALVVGVVVVVAGWWSNWRLGAEIVERDGVIEAYRDSVATANAEKDSLVVLVAVGDVARAQADTAHQRTTRRLNNALRTLSQRPVRVVRVPGETPVFVIDGVPATPEEIATTVERCNDLSFQCAAYRDTAQAKMSKDSVSIVQRDEVILAHEKKDTLQATKDSVQIEQIAALKKRSAGQPITVVLGPGIYYDMTSCESLVSVSDEFGTAVATQDCPTFRWGIGVTGGLDLVWVVDKLVWVGKVAGL